MGKLIRIVITMINAKNKRGSIASPCLLITVIVSEGFFRYDVSRRDGWDEF